MPLFPLSVTAYSVERCQIPECKMDLLLQVKYMVSVT
jgi:hypothetical protein